MEKENNKKKKNIVGIIVLIVSILLLVGLLLWNSLKDDKEMSTVEYEAQQLSLFKGDVAKQMDFIKTSGMSGEEGSYYLSNWINKNKSSYNSNSVDLASFQLTSKLGGAFDGVTSLVDTVGSLLDGFDVTNLLGGLLGGILGGGNGNATRTITMKSKTVCQSVSDSKYCVDKLSANVYISNVNSSKWAVLVHPFMTSGSLIYNSIGGMYEEQGYNVIAPDLRGFGNSDGSVAMGYLESLDIYDWIKDLNTNWADASRYGVNIAPDTIVVHGVSLGGATTLQLATNPDIAAANGREPYTKNLTELNVKGFVDDCGYTSMSGIVTGMLGGGGSTVSISSLFDSLGIQDIDFMSGLQDIFKNFGISGFDFNFGGLGGNSSSNILDKFNVAKDFTKQYQYLENAFSGSMNNSGNNNSNNNGTSNNASSNPYMNGKFDLGNLNIGGLMDKYGSSYNVPSKDEYSSYMDKMKDYWSKYTTGGNTWFQSNVNDSVVATPVGLLDGLLGGSNSNSGNFLDGLVGTVLMKLVGVGLTEDNYAKYSDVFSNGRHFPAGAKVAIIHGKADTTVPFSNADTVAKNVSPATLVKKWEVSGAPHAFVIIGTKTTEYKNLVANFTDCVENASCRSIN